MPRGETIDDIQLLGEGRSNGRANGVVDFSIPDEIPEHLQWVFRMGKGFVCLALLDRDTGEMHQQFYSRVDLAIAAVEKALLDNLARVAKGRPPVEIFYCPLKLKTRERHRGNTIDQRRLVWVDIDKPNPTGKVTLREWGFRIIESGTPGNFHAYAYVDRDLTLAQHRAIQEKLAKRFGGDDALKSDQPLLRLPSTTNYKNHHPKPEKRTERPMPVTLADRGKRTVGAVWLVRQLGGIKGASAALVHRVTTGDWEGTPRPKGIPDRVQRFVLMSKDDFAGHNVDWSGQAYAAVQTCVESGYTDKEIHVIIDEFEPGVEKYNGRWHTQIDHMIQMGRAKQRVKAEAEDSFWTQRSWLSHAHRYAQHIGYNPKAAVGMALLNALLDTPPFIMLPHEGSLNFYLALVGPSGTGKGDAIDHARKMIQYGTLVEPVGAGSGQALPHLFRRFDKKEGWQTIATRAHYDIDEVDTYGNLTGKESLLDGYLRSAWSGRMLSAKYVDESKNVHVPANSYRLCLTMGVQPLRAHILTDREAGGTPQRFLWLPVVDADMLDEGPANPGQIVKPDRDYREGDAISIPDWISREARADRKRRAEKGLRGSGEGGHAMLMKLKVAAAFALMEGRLDVTDEDWELAGVVVGWSDETYREIKSVMNESIEGAAGGRGRVKAIENLAAKEVEQSHGVIKCKEQILRALNAKKDKDGWLTHGQLNTICRRHREYLDDALAELRTQEKIERQGFVANTGVKTARFRIKGWTP